MTLTQNLDAARAGLVMINPAPYNAEAPPGALDADITPTELHYVRSNFAVPAHDGRLEIDGAVDNPTTLTLDDLRSMPAHDAVVTLECAGNGRLEMRPLPTGEPWGDYAASTARWTGVALHEVLKQVMPQADGVDVRFEGADHGAYHLTPVLPDTDRNNLSFVSALPLADAIDPAAGVLIAYAMNGEPLGPDHGAPFRVIVPHWYAVASVKWLKRIDVVTEPYAGEFQTRPLHLPMGRQGPRARSPYARPRPNHRSGARRGHRHRHLHGARQGLVRKRTSHPRRHQPHRRRRLAPGPARAARRPLPAAELVLRMERPRRGKTHPPSESHRRRRQRPTGRAAVEPARYGNNAIEVQYVDVHEHQAAATRGHAAVGAGTSEHAALRADA